ncbi:MAG: hypothetical protein ACOZBW_09125 [Thermodesulfobacteriota bacterium]
MMPSRHHLVTVLAIWGLCLWAVMPCDGYVIPGEMVIDRMIKALGDARGLAVTQTTMAGESPCPENNDADETSWFDPPGRFRFEGLEGKTKHVYVSAPQGAVTIVGDRVVSLSESTLMRYKEPLLYRDRPALMERLAAMGIDAGESSLGRLDGTVAFVLGARYPDLSVSQLWVDKETFLPFRLLVRHPGDKTLMETRYLMWHKGETFQFPLRVELYRDGRLIRTICGRTVTEKSSFEKDFFDITALRRRYPQVETPANGKPPDGTTDEIQQAIEDFKKLYE